MAGGCVRYRGGGQVSSGAMSAVLPRESRADLVRWLVKWLGGLESSIDSRTASPTLIDGQPRCALDARAIRAIGGAALFAGVQLAVMLLLRAACWPATSPPRSAVKRGLPPPTAHGRRASSEVRLE